MNLDEAERKATKLKPEFEFYRDVFLALLKEGSLSRNDEVLICCGGIFDRDVAYVAGLERVVISNLDENIQNETHAEFSPFRWKYLDCEDLDLEDESYDWVVVHNGLHHCHSPHHAMLEMYRVARKGIFFIEPQDSWFTRLGSRLGFGQQHELAAVAGNECKFGGVANSEIPNYVYRWSERDVEKTINTYAPHAKHKFRYLYALRIPWSSLGAERSRIKYLVMRVAAPILKLCARFNKALNNNTAYVVYKPAIPGDLQPWVLFDEESGITVDAEYLRGLYGGRDQ